MSSCYGHKDTPQWLWTIRCIAWFGGGITLGIGAMLTGISVGGSVSYNSGFSSEPYNCIVSKHRVEERVCGRSTCFPAYISLNITEIDVYDYELWVFTNGFNSFIEETKERLDIEYPIGKDLPCYYGTSGITFRLKTVIDSTAIAGFVFFGIAGALGVLWGLGEVLNCFLGSLNNK